MMDAQVMFWMTFCSSGLLGNKQPSTKVASERRIKKCNLESVIRIIDRIDFIFLQFQLICII